MGSDAHADAAIIERTERDRLRALVEGDMLACERLHAWDNELIPPGGGRFTRAEYLGGIAEGAMRYTVFEPVGEVRVRHYRTAAIIRYRARIEIESPDGGDAGPSGCAPRGRRARCPPGGRRQRGRR